MTSQTTAPATAHLRTISAVDVDRRLRSGAEMALLDPREVKAYAAGHPVLAVSVPLRDFEDRVVELVPRRTTPTVVYDDGTGVAAEAAGILADLGYTDVAVLAGGLTGWSEAGLHLVDGVGVVSKALGEFVADRQHTPKIDVDDLAELRRNGSDFVLVDTRPADEFARESIPGGLHAPGAELLYRIHDLVPSPTTFVVVNCAGRTRGIIGAQALRNAGLPNPVAALENGTAAWQVAGYEIAVGRTALVPPPSPRGLQRARAAAARVAERFEVSFIGPAELDQFRREADERTLFLFDVRHPDEFEKAHLRGARSVPGGQLVQARDDFVGTLGARVVLVDGPDAVRATITASWLLQMGLDDVAVYAEDLRPEETEIGRPAPAALPADGSYEVVSAADLSRRLADGDLLVLDIGSSRHYADARVPGARWVDREHLAEVVDGPAGSYPVVVTSDDGRAARHAVARLSRRTNRPLAVLDGGTAGWTAAGFPVEVDGGEWLSPPEDEWVTYRTVDERRTWLEGYTAWAEGVADRLAADGSVRFRTFER